MINLLPIDEKRGFDKTYALRFAAVVFFLLSVGMIVAYILLVPSFFLTITKERLVKNERELVEKSQEFIAFEDLRETVRIINERIMVMDRSREPLVHEYLITKLLLLKTDNILLTSIAYSKNGEDLQVELRGQARDRVSLVAFTQILERDDFIDVVSAPVSNYVSADNLNYVLQLALVPEKNDETAQE